MSGYSDVAWIFCREEQTSVIVGHQQMNVVLECESIVEDKSLMYIERSFFKKLTPEEHIGLQTRE